MSRVWGGTAFAKRSAAMKAPVGLLSNGTVLRSKIARWRGFAPRSSQKRKTPPTQRSDGFCRVNQRQNESGVLRGSTFFLGSYPLKVVVITVRTTTFSAGFGIKDSMEAWVRQDGFAKFIAVK